MVALPLLQRAGAQEAIRQPRVVTIPAPIGGWNARDSEDQMKETDAIALDNWFPGFGKVSCRKGFSSHATGVGSGAVDTLAVFDAAGTTKLLAASSTNIYDATSAGAATSLVGSKTSGRWQTAMMAGVMGLVNGADAPLTYDGSTVSAMTIAALAGDPHTLTVANIIGINIFKSRSYFWEKNSSIFWYSATLALGGDCESFDLGEVYPEGGKIVAMVTWTRDGGAGSDDLAVFLMSAGYALVYQGDDPGAAPGGTTFWALVGVFKTGTPLSVRGIEKIGGDALIVTREGYALLSKLLPGGQGAPGVTISDKIINAAIQAATTGADDYGWQAIFYPAEKMLLVNYPQGSTAVYEQHVVNTATGAWCRFKGMNGSSWAVFNGQLYFGGAGGVVYKALTGTDDAGAEIALDARQAFNYLGSRAQRKRLAMVRPVMAGTGLLPISLNVDTDFGKRVLASAVVNLGDGSASTPWGSPWGSPWSTGSKERARWFARSALGYAFSLRLRSQIMSQTADWYSTSLAFQPAGIV